MTDKITVVDYGVGNLYSVRRALECCGATRIAISGRQEDIEDADRLILPGVGAFGDGMEGLRSRALVDPIVRFANTGKPVLGICLGMQMLATAGEEFGTHPGLDLIPGKVVAIPRTDGSGRRLKVPFIGWTPLDGDKADFASSCLHGFTEKSAVYLVHSYHFLPDDPSSVLATYLHGDHRITAAIRRGNITGVQFHPEKSGKVGLQIMANFLR